MSLFRAFNYTVLLSKVLMRHFILIALVFTATLAWAEKDAPKIKDSLKAEDTVQKEQIQEAGKEGNTKEYTSQKYTVKEETDIVEQALNVFKKKGRPSSLYRKRVWISDTLDGENTSFLSFTTNDRNESIVFSPDEEFVYYVEISSGGRRRLKGVKIGSREEFFVDAAVERFFIETCEDQKTSYLVVLDGKKIEGYHVYDLQGRSIVLPDMPADVNDLKRVICY